MAQRGKIGLGFHNMRSILCFSLITILLLGSFSTPISVLSQFNRAAFATTTSSITSSATGEGNFEGWQAVGGSKVDAVNDNSDATYIFTDNNEERQTFGFEKNKLPAGSTINKVTVTVLAKKTDDPTTKIRILVEQGKTGSEIDESSEMILTKSFTSTTTSLFLLQTRKIKICGEFLKNLPVNRINQL